MPEGKPMPDKEETPAAQPGAESLPQIAGAPEIPRPAMPPPPSAQVAARRGFDWEQLVGIKLFSWLAGIALVLATIFFLRYSIDHGWLTTPVRMALGFLAGVFLLVVCEWKAARRYPVTANALDAAGIAILYATAFASHSLWQLIGMPAAFALMALVTVIAITLAIRHDSLFIALLGQVGAFFIPALLSTGQDHPFGLFSYLLLLDIGLVIVARRKRWPVLPAVCLIMTTFYQLAWMVKFLIGSKTGTGVGIFAACGALAFVLNWMLPRETGNRLERIQAWAVHLATLVPLVFAVYLAAVPAYGERWVLLLGFVSALAVALAASAIWRGPGWLHMAGAVGSLLAIIVWMARCYPPSAWPMAAIWAAALGLFYLIVPMLADRLGRAWPPDATPACLIAPLFALVFPILCLAEPRTSSPWLLFAILFGFVALAGTWAVIRRTSEVYGVVAILALATEAVWSIRHLAPENLFPALLVYGGFALLYLGLPAAARRFGRPLEPSAAGFVFPLGALVLTFFLASRSVSPAALGGLAVLLAGINLGILREAAVRRDPRFVPAGLAISWLVLGAWWWTAGLHSQPLPSLAVVTLLTLLSAGGNSWLARRLPPSEAGKSAWPGAIYLALAGHVFVLYAAVQPQLALPPWPLLGTLLVLDLALSAVALYTRQGWLHLAALLGSFPVVAAWVLTTRTVPWPVVAVMAALLLAGLGIAVEAAARKLRMEGSDRLPFPLAAVLGLFAAQAVAVIAALLPGAPDIRWLIGVHVLLAAALLASAAWIGDDRVPLLAAATSGAALLTWRLTSYEPAQWPEGTLFAVLLLLTFILSPLLRGRRVAGNRGPYLAAVLLAGLVFLVLRVTLTDGGYDAVIGLIPLGLAALMALLLWQLLRLEPPGSRDLGRLALMAAAVLAFVTVAVPLQLEREWLTLGWALEGVAVIWLWPRLRHPGLFYLAAGLFAAVFIRLSLNPAVLSYHPRAALPVWNWHLYTYLVAASCFLLAARRLVRTATDRELLEKAGVRLAPVLTTGGIILLFLLLNIEIADFFSTGSTLMFQLSSGNLAQDLTYTMGWALFGIGLLVTGILRRRPARGGEGSAASGTGGGSRPVRVAAIGLLLVTVIKCFLHDLWHLGGLYRVGSFVGLAICLGIVAVMLQRFVFRVTVEQEPKEGFKDNNPSS